MAKRGGGSGRKYVRDSIGRFASKGFSGQSSGRGARLKAKGKKRDGGGAIVKPKRIGEMKNTISKSSSKRKVNASSRATDRQIARDIAARSKPTAARTSKAPANKAKAAYKRASADARMRNADLRGADAKERRMANSASAKVKNMQRRRSTSEPKAGAEAPRSKQKAREFARIQRAYGNERRAYAAKGDGFGSAKQSRTASVAKRARDIYSGKISASYKTTSRLTRTQNPDVLKARIKKGEKLTAARAKKKSVTANSARVTGKLTRPVATGNIRRTGGRLGPKNTIKPGPKSPRTKMNRAIDNVIKKGKALKGSAEKLRGVKKQADALRGRMLKEDKGRLGKALSKPSVTDKRSRDYGGRLTKAARGQDAATGGKKSSARRADRAEANIPMRGRRAKQLDASISRAAKQVKAAETARLMKPKAQIKSERAAKAEAKRQVAAAKPKRVRSAESLRVSRAKRITKERSISLNPAGNSQKGAGRMAANAKRTQDRALAFYKGKAKPAAAKPAAANKISRSPRQLNKDEKIARDVMTDKRFKSDRQRVTEMQRRGVKPGTDVVGLVANVRSKQGGGTTSRIKPAAAKTKLKRSGKKIGVGRLTTNKEQGRKGIVSMSSQAKAARKGAVAERKSAKMSRIAERQSEIVARRQGRRASNYNPDGTFNQSTANANQRRLGRSKQLQEKLSYAGGGKNIASKALSKRRTGKRRFG
jgi:hypothetical protein